MLISQGQLASNYTAWLNAAGVAAGRAAAAVREEAWEGAGRWLEGEHGLYAHLRAAVADDGWEWEGSTYYHGFVLRAALLALRSTAPSALPADVVRVLAGMTDVLAAVATPGGVLPALHDGPYRRNALGLEWLELIALAQQSVPSDALAAVADRVRAELGDADDALDRELGGWFAGPPLLRRAAPAPVTVFPSTGYAVLRAAGVHALVDFGPHGGSHGHRDKLSLYLYGDTTAWQPDPGQVPYAHPEFRDLYTSTAAHPAFRVDGAEQAECAGALTAADAVSVTAEVTEAYEGVRAVRRVAVGPCYLVDLLTVEVTGRENPGSPPSCGPAPHWTYRCRRRARCAPPGTGTRHCTAGTRRAPECRCARSHCRAPVRRTTRSAPGPGSTSRPRPRTRSSPRSTRRRRRAPQ